MNKVIAFVCYTSNLQLYILTRLGGWPQTRNTANCFHAMFWCVFSGALPAVPAAWEAEAAAWWPGGSDGPQLLHHGGVQSAGEGSTARGRSPWQQHSGLADNPFSVRNLMYYVSPLSPFMERHAGLLKLMLASALNTGFLSWTPTSCLFCCSFDLFGTRNLWNSDKCIWRDN